MDAPSDTTSNAIKVCVRIRPMNASETTRGDTPTCTAMSDGQTLRTLHYSGNRRKWESQTLRFDRVFGPDSTQLDVFSHSGVEALVEDAASGFAATVFCFGQTGSGKTYTMTGPYEHRPETDGTAVPPTATDDSDSGPAAPAAPPPPPRAVEEDGADPDVVIDPERQGIQFRALHLVASMMADAERDGGSLVVRAAMYEVYNEQVNDLLGETTNLKVRWNANGGGMFFIESLMLVQCTDLDDLLCVLQQGLSVRKRASHRLNDDSSRSHAVLQLAFERTQAAAPPTALTEGEDGAGAPLPAPPKLGKLNLVDLAGSEKLRDSGSEGSTATETRSINQSLLALGKVISALASRAKEAFVPYRDSTLTRLLMDSLGGNAKTMMVACVTPSSKYTEESRKTLRYAVRAGSIVNLNPTVRVDPRRLEVFELRSELELLRRENAALKERIEVLMADRGVRQGGGPGGVGETPREDGSPPPPPPLKATASPGQAAKQQPQSHGQPTPPSSPPPTTPPTSSRSQPLPPQPGNASAVRPKFAPPFLHSSAAATTDANHRVMVNAQAMQTFFGDLPRNGTFDATQSSQASSSLASMPSSASRAPAWHTGERQPPHHLPPTFADPSPSSSSSYAVAAAAAADDNAQLRAEVAQLKTMILESRAMAIATNSPGVSPSKNATSGGRRRNEREEEEDDDDVPRGVVPTSAPSAGVRPIVAASPAAHLQPSGSAPGGAFRPAAKRSHMLLPTQPPAADPAAASSSSDARAQPPLLQPARQRPRHF